MLGPPPAARGSLRFGLHTFALRAWYGFAALHIASPKRLLKGLALARGIVEAAPKGAGREAAVTSNSPTPSEAQGTRPKIPNTYQTAVVRHQGLKQSSAPNKLQSLRKSKRAGRVFQAR